MGQSIIACFVEAGMLVIASSLHLLLWGANNSETAMWQADDWKSAAPTFEANGGYVDFPASSTFELKLRAASRKRPG